MAWETGSGLVEAFTATIVDAWFERGDEYDNVTLNVQFANIESDELPVSEIPDEFTRYYTVGGTDNWEVVDKRTVAPLGKESRKVNSNSRYGRLIDAAVALDGVLDVLTDRAGDEDHPERDANHWIGLRFSFEPDTREFTIDGNTVESTIPLPVEFHGVDGDAEAPAEDSGPSRDELEERLTELAENADSHEEFLMKALDVPGVTDDSELFGAIGDDTDDGFYAKATA